MSLILSPEAIRDLQSIATYTFHAWGAKQETIYLRGIWRKLEEIRDFPQAYPLRKDLLSGCRSARHEKHVIFFMAEEEVVRVIRILHGAMDFNNHLSGDIG